jgi:hypothetical protein
MPAIEWATQAYQTRSTQLLAQQAINCFVEPTPKEGKTTKPVYGIPGLTLFSRMGSGPILGMHVMGQSLFILSGTGLYSISYTDVLAAAPGSPVPAGLIGETTLGGLVSMADNGSQLVMVDGNVGWIHQPGGIFQVTTATAFPGDTFISANISGTINIGDTILVPLDNGTVLTTTSVAQTNYVDGFIQIATPLPVQVTAGATIADPSVQLAQITAAAFMPASTVRYFDGYFVFNAAGTRQFFISGINDGSSYSGLDFATASAGSDDIIAVEIYHEQLLLLCRLHTEIWWDAGNVSFPFQRYDAALIARGLSAPLAVCSEDNTVFWMGEDGIFYRLNGFAPQRISTFAMEHAWAQYPLKFLDASCFVLDQEGHKFVIVNFPSGCGCWAYDISSQLWAQRQSFGAAFV